MTKNYQQNRKDFGKQISDSTINNYLRNIKVFFNYLEDNQILKINTVSKCKFIKNIRVPKDQLSDEEFNRLMDVTKFHEYSDSQIINLIMDTGMRLSETLNLTINNVDLVRRTILIPAEISKGKKDRLFSLVIK